MASSSKNSDDAFPTKQLAVLALCRLAEPVAFTSILSYSFVMVQQLNGTDRDASFYSGLLVSAFAVAETMTVMFWGALSDRVGRKPIVLLGLAGTALSSLLFGFATNYWVALGARMLGGLLNGNVAVMQTMVSEMVKRPEHEPRAYAVQPFMWSLGSIFGSAMGGFLAEPAKYYPSLFPADGLFGRFPYLLPNLVAAVIIGMAIVQGLLLLEETNPNVQSAKTSVRNEAPDVRASVSRASMSERTPLRPKTRHDSVLSTMSYASSRPSIIGGAIVPPRDHTLDIRRPSMDVSIQAMSESAIEEEEEEANSTGSPEPRAFSTNVLLLVAALSLFAYHQMASGTLFPIWLLDEPKTKGAIDLIGGFDYTVHDVGVFMAINGVIALFVQAFVFAPFVERVGVWNTTVAITLLYPLFYALPPFITLLPHSMVPAGLFVVLSLQVFCHVLYFPCVLIQLKNATHSTAVLGRVNGLAMSASCGARTIAPPLSGLIYSNIGSAAAWWFCAGFAVIAIVELYWLPRGLGGDTVTTTSEGRSSGDEES